MILEARSPKSRCGSGLLSPEASLLGVWMIIFFLSPPVAFTVCVPISSSFKDLWDQGSP